MVPVLFAAVLVGSALTGLIWLSSILRTLREWLEEIIDA